MVTADEVIEFIENSEDEPTIKDICSEFEEFSNPGAVMDFVFGTPELSDYLRS